MGTKIVVSSTTYSMSGEEENRPEFLKSVMFAATMSGGNGLLGETISNRYLNGPAIKQRQFLQWAKRVSYAGLPTFNVINASVIDPLVIAPEIDVDPGLVTQIQSASIESADFIYFAEKYILDNNPSLINEDWAADYEKDTHEITIQFDSDPDIIFDAGIFNSADEFLVVRYIQTEIDNTGDVVGGSQMLIYKMGSGNTTYDALATDNSENSEFLPFIPIRLNNLSITDNLYQSNGLYADSKKAYRRALPGQRFSTLIDDIEENESIDDIDYAYMSYGVPLNVSDNVSKKYLYDFFAGLITHQDTSSPTTISNFISDISTYDGEIDSFNAWVADQDIIGSPGFGTDRPDLPILNLTESTTIKIRTNDPKTEDYDNRISWVNIEEEFFNGVGQVGAKKDDVWITEDASITWDQQVGIDDTTRTEANTLDVIYIFKQITDTTYKRLTISGLLHKNFIYGGKSVDITASEALADLDVSGFLIPIHYPTMQNMGMVDSTQVATANSYLTFNSYEVFKTKWYQSFFFMIIIIIATIIIATLTGYISPEGIGLLGSNASVGVTVGLTGTTAVVVGAILNTLAAILVSRVLLAGSVEIFGDRIGSIIGAVLVFLTFGGLENILINFGSAQSILALSDVLANGYSGLINANINDLDEDLNELKEQHKVTMNKVKELMAKLNGNNGLYFNPLSLTDTNNGNKQMYQNYLPEGLDEFIHRTTLVGSDVVDITLSMVYDYAELNLQLPKQ